MNFAKILSQASSSIPHDAMQTQTFGMRPYFSNTRSDFGNQQVSGGRRYRPDLASNPAAVAAGLEQSQPKPNMPMNSYYRSILSGNRKPTVAMATAENTVKPEVEEITNVPPPQSNEVAPKPVFNQPAQASANQIFGDLFARQNAVGAPPLFKKKCNKKKY